nr:uncharacterized protein LOC112936582 [Oryza sativa Japonica Group]
MSECATTARMKRKEYMQLKRGMKRARTDGNEEKGRADPTYISNMELKNTLSWNMTWPKCMCRLCQGPNGIYKNIKNVVEPKYCNIQLMQLKEPSVINSAIIYSQLKKARRAKELAKIARMKRKEQNTLKRSRKGTRTNKNVITKEIISSDSKIWNFGGPTCMCQHCHALMWHAERSLHSTVKQPSFGLCCKQGKVALPPLKEQPPYLTSLLTRDGGRSTNYQQNIRSYNSMFAFTSMGGTVDRKINNGHGPYIFRLNGQNHHHIGTLLPEGSNKPRFQQLYVYDTENEIENRIEASKSGASNAPLDQKTIASLLKMLDENNTLAQTFRMARDRFKEDDYHNYTLRLLDNRDQDGRQDNMPSASEVALLIVKDPTKKSYGRDIPTAAEASAIKGLLTLFGEATGLKTNFCKSAITPIQCSDQQRAMVESILSCRVEDFPITYLGLPLGTRQPTKAEVQPILDKLAKKVADWKPKMLSIDGRLCLIKSVLMALPVHFMSVLQLPRWAVKDIERK